MWELIREWKSRIGARVRSSEPFFNLSSRQERGLSNVPGDIYAQIILMRLDSLPYIYLGGMLVMARLVRKNFQLSNWMTFSS